MGILIGMMGSVTIERLSLSTRLVSRSSLHSHIMGIIRTDITRTGTTLTGTTITGDPRTDMVTAVDPTSWRRSADLLAPGIIMEQSMGSWGRKRGEQFALTNAITI
jgi:hypothetical protein